MASEGIKIDCHQENVVKAAPLGYASDEPQEIIFCQPLGQIHFFNEITTQVCSLEKDGFEFSIAAYCSKPI